MNPVSELNVEAGNKLIAEFRDGFYDKRESLIEVYNDAFDMDNTSLHGFSVNPNMRKKFVKKIRISDLQYHSSWEWLMPVVEKIEQIVPFSVIIYHRQCEIICRNVIPEGWRDIVKEDIEKIKCVWQAVVQFIQWYNKINKP